MERASAVGWLGTEDIGTPIVAAKMAVGMTAQLQPGRRRLWGTAGSDAHGLARAEAATAGACSAGTQGRKRPSRPGVSAGSKPLGWSRRRGARVSGRGRVVRCCRCVRSQGMRAGEHDTAKVAADGADLGLERDQPDPQARRSGLDVPICVDAEDGVLVPSPGGRGVRANAFTPSSVPRTNGSTGQSLHATRARIRMSRSHRGWVRLRAVVRLVASARGAADRPARCRIEMPGRGTMAPARAKRPALLSLDAPISLGCVVVEPGLPRPHVHYPSHYGTFIGFAESPDAPASLCSCTETLLVNAASPRDLVSDPWRASAFPAAVVTAVKAGGAFVFASRCCHRCTRTSPSVRWCHEMYGGKFKQTFGWYIQQAGWRLRGKHEGGGDAVIAAQLDAIGVQVDAVRRERVQFQLRVVGAPVHLNEPTAEPGAVFGSVLSSEDAEYLRSLGKREAAAERAVSRVIENVVREEFGYPRVGERWHSETDLLSIVRGLFPGEEVVAHDRPAWLHGLELDVHLPHRRLAFEYQGKQHFQPVDAWGGAPALRALRERDARKVEACRLRSWTLIVLTYEEPLTPAGIRERVEAAGIALVEQASRQVQGDDDT